MLSSQFVSGLRQEIKMKLAVEEGSIDQLLVKARFEEAKLRDFGRTHPKQPGNPTASSHPQQGGEDTTMQHRDRRIGAGKVQRDKPKGVCHECGSTSHYQRQCPMRRVVSRETPGQGNGKVAGITRAKVPTLKEDPIDQNTTVKQVTRSKEENSWQESVIMDALEGSLVTLHGVKSASQPEEGMMGPIPTATISVEGRPAKALIDTRSPVTIVSLSFLMNALVQQLKLINPSKEVIREEVKKRLEPTAFRLKSYSGDTLPIVKQACLQLSRGSYSISAWVQIQKDAPVELLLGTDLQPALGFCLVDEASTA